MITVHTDTTNKNYAYVTFTKEHSIPINENESIVVKAEVEPDTDPDGSQNPPYAAPFTHKWSFKIKKSLAVSVKIGSR